ncbi:MAG: MarR family winged helix-turn-helix transcriptional regulator [Syntrophomonadaceae bacterium]|nr:MarR family winged helix-turn-helix transcriptional regulator [Syntrophomonadaceae bacterium]MDD3023707.1 MarR family winged helix-turn-helix transcriptional regulator [Syntrophomonadaceae bacterium]
MHKAEVNKIDPQRAMEVGNSCLCNNLRRCARLATQIYEEALRPLGLKVTQFSLLMSLTYYGDISINRLARVMGMDRTTLSRNMRVLQKRGLIAVDRGNDRREQILSLSNEGREILNQALPIWEEVQAKMAELLNLERMENVVLTLRNLNKDLS